MENDLFIALLNPAIALLLATGFVVAWLQDRANRYLAVLALGYTATALGFLLQYVELPVGFLATKFLSNVFFATAGILIPAAICIRYHRPVPIAALSILAGGGLLALLWFMVVEPDLTWRILSMNIALGGISLVAAAEIRAVENKGPIEKVLFFAALLTGANFIVRTIVVIAVEGVFLSYEGLYTSVYWTSAMLTHAVLSLAIALCLLMGAALDIIGDLRVESVTDPLSGLLNRRGFAESARQSLARTKTIRASTCLVLADLDHFKAVNDAHGHAVGDTVIRAFADLLRVMAGEQAIVGRIGGEEFAVLLPGCDLPTARLFAEGARTALSDGGLSGVSSITGRNTASFGVAAHTGEEELELLIKRADEALYQAKRSGRDRVRLVGSRPDISAIAVGAR